MSDELTLPVGERKHVTAVFLDLVGFSEVASVSDPEDIQSWLDGYYRQSGQIVEANGGEVTEYLGDGVVAVFGLSHADELAALKAVDAALRAVSSIGNDVSGPLKLALRAGVATGEVAVRAETTRDAWPRIAGMVTTLAQRVQERAAPGTVMISESTKRLLRGRFKVTAVPEQMLKGFSEPQTLYLPYGTPHKDTAALSGNLVARERECAAIEAADKPVLIIGQAGIGKTALAVHVANQASARTVFHAERINGGSSYHPFKDWVFWYLGASIPSINHIRVSFSDLSDEDHLILALIMGMPEGQTLLTKLSSFALKARIEASLWRAIRSAQSHGVLVFEDLHWFDIASFGVIQHILRSPYQTGLKILLTSREDSKLGLHLVEKATLILALNPLSRNDAQQMLAVLSGSSVSDTANKKLVDRAGGVPLFIEQLYKHAGSRLGVEDAIPETLMDLLAARIDDTGFAKPTLQRASAIGRIFSFDMLMALTPPSEDPRPALREGVAAGVLIRQSTSEWAFAHVLLAQATYHSLLRKTREALHARIVDILREQYPGRLVRDPSFLASHQRKARQIVPAIHSYLTASKVALMQGAFADAEAHARDALALCDDIKDDVDSSNLEIACYTALGSTLMQVQGFCAEPVREAFDSIHRIARTNPSTSKDSAPALFGSFSHAIIAGDKLKADEFCDLLSNLASTVPLISDATEVMLAALGTRTCACFYEGDFQTQFRQIAKIRALYKIEDHAEMIARYGMDIFAAAQMFEAPARAISGDLDKVLELVAETDAHQAALNIPVMLPYALIWGAVPLFYAGQQRAALDRLREGITLADEQGTTFWQLNGKTWAFIIDPMQSQTESGLADFGANIATQRAIGANVATPYFAACYAERLAEAGRLAEAYAVSSTAVKEAREGGLHCWYSEILRIHANISRRDNHPGEADAGLKLAIETSKRQGAALWTLRAMLDMLDAAEPDEVDLAKVVSDFSPGADLPEMRRARLLLST